MKNLFSGLWNAPASTVAAAITAGIAAALKYKPELLSDEVTVTLLALSAFLAVFSGKTKK